MKLTKAQKEAKIRYEKKLRYKKVTFYLNEQELANFADKLNFQKFVKWCLKTYIDFNYPYADEISIKVPRRKFIKTFMKGSEK